MKIGPPPPESSAFMISTIEAHAGGEPLRIVTGGFPPLPGKTMLEKRRYAMTHFDGLRKALMWEPRGHADMYGCLLTEPERSNSQMGVLFMHNEGFSTMCGHGIIALATAALETGLVKSEGENHSLKIDTPAGQVTVSAKFESGRVSEVSFLNVPSFVYALDQVSDIRGIGKIRFDVAFGGAFYVFCSAEETGVQLNAQDFRNLIEKGRKIKAAVAPALRLRHPLEKDLGFLYGTVFVGKAHNPAHHSRNVCVFADGEVDRSPTGTGISARAALHFARGEVKKGDPFTVESILGTCFTARVVETLKLGPYEAVIPEVTGSAFITGRNETWLDARDPFPEGFLLR